MQDKIKKTASVIKMGGVALVPTDTVCGIAACCDNEDAIRRIYEIKNRNQDKPLAMLVSSIESVWERVDKTAELEDSCSKYWPGAVTLIMSGKDGSPVGFRMPDYEPLLEVIDITGPLCATSANISGDEAPGRIEEVAEEIREKVDIIADFAAEPSGKPSKIINLCGGNARVIRD
ncbi:MAG: L-threonylcarbamoyladenylate synthase [Elusimicrobiota bacterium]